MALVVCNARAPRRTPDGILVLPWEQFLQRLWAGAIVTCRAAAEARPEMRQP